jgi:HEAT repeat protein
MLVALPTVVGSVSGGPRDPVYEGKDLRQWLAETNRSSKRWELTREAAEAVKAIGTNAVPLLLSDFESDWPKWYQAVSALALLGSNASSALPTLARYIDDPKRGPNAAYVMDKTGEAGLPYLLEALSSTNANVVSYTIHHLSERGKAAEPAIPRIIQLVDHPDKGVRIWAIAFMRNFPFAADSCVPALRRALSDSVPDVRRGAAFALGRFSSAGKPAVPELLRLLEDPDPYCALLGSNALARIDPSALPRKRP